MLAGAAAAEESDRPALRIPTERKHFAEPKFDRERRPQRPQITRIRRHPFVAQLPHPLRIDPSLRLHRHSFE